VAPVPESATPAGTPPRAHLAQLDALRAIAVLGVLLSHFMYRYEAFAPAGSLGVRLSSC
jgi:peptidoglycan/LPS O-acetylase OafA/YrhL